MLEELIQTLPKNETILNNFIKAYSIINNPNYKNIICTISGGSDSDIVLDICTKCDQEHKIKYVWFDTGLEYQATKNHLNYLEEKYNIELIRVRGTKSIPLSNIEYGQPFLSKEISEKIERLQRHNFKWEDKTLSELLREYPNCKASLRWWCNDWGEKSRFNIDYRKGLKEFMISNQPTFRISAKCCEKAKKEPLHKILKGLRADLNIYGVRKSEGGARASAYKNCFSIKDNVAEYRPLFYYTDQDKKEYENHFNIIHSECYTCYGLKRTGCCGCPFGLNFEDELETIKDHEPNLYKAINNIFKDSYEYTKKYKEFRKGEK